MAHFVLNPEINRIMGTLADARGPLKSYGEHRLTAFRRSIRLGVDPYQQRYRPLSPRYAKQKQQQWGNQPILWASGRMVRSHDYRIQGNRFTESLQSPAPGHAKGNPAANLPKRAPLPDDRGLPMADRQALWNAIVKHGRRSFDGL